MRLRIDFKWLLTAGGWFVAWTALSFYAHYFALSAIGTAEKGGGVGGESRMGWLVALALSIGQCLVGAIVIKIFLSLLRIPRFARAVNVDPPSAQHSSDHRLSHSAPSGARLASAAAMALSHAMATLCTNASISFVNAGSAFTIKSFEPVTTAALSSMLLGTALTAATVIALPLVVCGSAGFVAQPTLESSGSFGLGLAFISNVMYGVRNINLKLSHRSTASGGSDRRDGGDAHKLEQLLLISLYSVAALLLPVIVLLISGVGVELDVLTVATSGIFHVSYTIISTCVILKYMSVVGHATCNLLKRVIIAIAFFAAGKQNITATNWVMGAVFLIGLFIYVYPKGEDTNGKQENPSLVFTFVTIAVVSLMACIAWQTPTTSQNTNMSYGSLHTAVQNMAPLNLHSIKRQRLDEMSLPGLTPAEVDFVHNVKVFKQPMMANLLSNRLTTVDEVVQESRRLHDQVFGYLLGGYRRAVLVNVFQWFNKGDHLITIGQRKVLDRLGIELIYVCYYPGGGCNFKSVSKDSDVVVLIQGAGYIGHPAHEFMLDITVSGFPKNRIVMLPISVCHPTPPCTDIDQFAAIAARHEDFHVVLRDVYSLVVAKQYFTAPGIHLYLAPDSAWAVGSLHLDIVPVYDIVWLKRDDWESQNDPMPKMPANLRVQVTDWSDDWMDQKTDDFWESHQLRTISGVAFLARARVVVSDRLHAHIMSQLMGKPNVVINSETRKQEHYYMTWEKGIETSRLVFNNEEALKAALELLERYGGGAGPRHPVRPES